MSHRPHALTDDFPELAQRIHELRESDAHFARLLDDYDAVNDEVHLAETSVKPMSEEAETTLRKERARLKDELYRRMTAQA